MKMTHKQAIRLAIEALNAQIKTLAVDANLFDAGLAQYPHARKSSQKRAAYRQAIQALENLEPRQLGLFDSEMA